MTLHQDIVGFNSVADRGSSRRLLIVDDDETICALVARVARSLGFEVAIAAHGAAAAQWLAFKRCDVLVTDIHMPESDGLELIRTARRLQPELAIIAMSGGGYFGFTFLRSAQLLGAAGTLAKPFEVAQLSGLLRSIAHLNLPADGDGASSACPHVAAEPKAS